MDRVGQELARALKGVDQALRLDGLPGYVAESRAAAGDVRTHVADLHAAAAILRTRALLAKLADCPDMGMFKAQLIKFEQMSPKAFMGAINDSVKSLAAGKFGEGAEMAG